MNEATETRYLTKIYIVEKPPALSQALQSNLLHFISHLFPEYYSAHYSWEGRK